MDAPYTYDHEDTTESKKLPARAVLIFVVQPRAIGHGGTWAAGVLLRDPYDKHDFIVGADNVFVGSLTLLVDNPTMFVVLPTRLLRISRTLTLDNVIVG